jgi:predicted nucleic acid-binding protein
VLLNAHRRRRIDHTGFENALTRLASLPLEVDEAIPRRAWVATLSLAQLHGLTLYDAIYLDLALTRGLPLATLDRQLRQAATMDGVTLLPA